MKHTRTSNFEVCKKKLLTIFSSCILLMTTWAQNTIDLKDLSFFEKPGNTWRISGDVNADLKKDNTLTAKPGSGILINQPDEKNHGQDLLTSLQHSDADVEFDYMMARGSNSGVYLQGRYEIQLLDSWGITRPRYGDNGGIYERWNEARGKGNEGYEGYAPRQNVSMAPGLWQHLKISFQAPRFDAAGVKTANARILRVELNGIVMHENVELLGPTRGSMGEEVPTGPLRIQGDHGAVAFKNISIVNYDKQRPELSNLRYSIYKGKFNAEPDFKTIAPEANGSSVILTSNLNNKITSKFLVRYTGILTIKETGEYLFNMNVPGGVGLIKIDNKTVVPMGGGKGSGKITLPAGDHPLELLYMKLEDWEKPSLALSIAGPGIREFLISDANTGMSDEADPILVDGTSTSILRSFMDIPQGPRITHAVNVSSSQQLHYTYDLNKGNIVQVWKGGFLDATPMWHDRGDGSSKPLGATRFFGNPSFSLGIIASAGQPWITDSAGTGYLPKGYVLDAANRPVFRYFIYGAKISDAIKAEENGHGLQREITADNAPPNMYVLLARAAAIKDIGNGMYLIDNKSYFLRLESTNVNATIRDINGIKELIAPIQNKLAYTIIF